MKYVSSCLVDDTFTHYRSAGQVY